jgi:hypothetical protein
MAIASPTGEEALYPSPITSKCSSDWDADIVCVEGVGVYIASGTFIPSAEIALSR